MDIDDHRSALVKFTVKIMLAGSRILYVFCLHGMYVGGGLAVIDLQGCGDGWQFMHQPLGVAVHIHGLGEG